MPKKTDQELKETLTPEQYHICREKGTEPPFSGTLLHNDTKGCYLCACCDNPLFDSNSKFDSKTGWPSFYKPHKPSSISEKNDPRYSAGTQEVVCADCEAHLGHVFTDGPQPTGLRFCINSLALKFTPETKKNA